MGSIQVSEKQMTKSKRFPGISIYLYEVRKGQQHVQTILKFNYAENERYRPQRIFGYCSLFFRSERPEQCLSEREGLEEIQCRGLGGYITEGKGCDKLGGERACETQMETSGISHEE